MKTLPPEIHHVIHKWPLPRASAGALASGGTGSGDAADTKDGDDSEAEEAGAGDTTDGDDGDAAEEAGDAVRMSAAPSTRKRLDRLLRSATRVAMALGDSAASGDPRFAALQYSMMAANEADEGARDDKWEALMQSKAVSMA